MEVLLRNSCLAVLITGAVRTRSISKAPHSSAHLPPFRVQLLYFSLSPWCFTDFLSAVSVVEVDIPKPGPGQLLVHMTYMAVHPADVASLMGVYPGFQPDSLPAVPGLEGVGVVVGVGPRLKIPRDLKGLRIGSRVVPLLATVDRSPPAGAWSEYVVIDTESVVLVPDAVSDESAAQLVVNPVTVVGLLDLIQPPPGSYILQAAGGSALGKQLIQLANDRSVHVISTVRRCEQVTELQSYGTSPHNKVICTSGSDDGDGVTGTIDWVSQVMQYTNGTGAYGAVDPVSGPMTGLLQESVRSNGLVVIYGVLAGLQYQGNAMPSLFRGVSTTGYWVARDLSTRPVSDRRKVLQETMRLLERNVIIPHTGQIFPLDHVREAVLEANRPGRSSDGKVLLKTRPECAKRSRATEEL